MDSDHLVPRPATLLLAAAIGTLLSGCEDSAGRFEAQLSQLQAEVTRAQSEAQDARRALAAAREEQSATGGAASKSADGATAPDTAKIEANYTAAAQALKAQIVEKLKGFTVETCTLYSVRAPENAYPYTSEIALALRSTDGNKPYRVGFPVKADYSGNWVFPSVDEIVARIDASKNVTAVDAADVPPASSEIQLAPGAMPPPVLESNGTVVIQWPDSPKPRAATPAAPASTSAPSPSAPAAAAHSGDAPAAVMPVNRDVLIKF